MRIGLLLGVLALSALVLAPGAGAKPGDIRLPGTLFFQLDLGRVDGYRLGVVGGGGEFWLSASKGGTSATYSAHGFANRHRLEADLGRFGHVSVRLQRSPRVSHKLLWGRNCHGRRPWQLHGLASGRIRFRGLDGFVSIDKQRAKAEVVRSFDSVCKRESGSIYVVASGSSEPHRPAAAGPGPRVQIRSDTVAAKRQAGGELVEFRATNLLFPGLSSGFLEATTTQRRDGVLISNSASAPVPEGGSDLRISHRGVHPETATVRGAGPFSGEGAYRQLAGGASEWNGSLAVELPGEGAVALSGPGFHAKVCHGSFFTTHRCQSSGSHSQSLFETRLSWSR